MLPLIYYKLSMFYTVNNSLTKRSKHKIKYNYQLRVIMVYTVRAYLPIRLSDEIVILLSLCINNCFWLYERCEKVLRKNKICENRDYEDLRWVIYRWYCLGTIL